VDDADATVLRHADGGFVLGDSVHRRGDQRDVEGELAAELRLELDISGEDVAGAGHEENVVERQSLANPAIAHVAFALPPQVRGCLTHSLDGRAF